MRVAALNSDVLVCVSEVWQTTCTAVRSQDEGFVIDSPIYPSELQALPGLLEEAGFPVSGLLATHGDWDHLLGRLAFPGASLGCAESTATRLTKEPGKAQRRLREFDAEQYVTERPPLGLGSFQALPVPGNLELGPSHEVELHETPGHTADGTAYWMPWVRVLVCGDYLSPVEIPMLSEGGSLEAYRATLTRLESLVAQASWVVPGHGAPVDQEQASRILAEDVAYIEQLQSDPSGATVPKARSSAAQRNIHAANLAFIGAQLT